MRVCSNLSFGVVLIALSLAPGVDASPHGPQIPHDLGPQPASNQTDDRVDKQVSTGSGLGQESQTAPPSDIARETGSIHDGARPIGSPRVVSDDAGAVLGESESASPSSTIMGIPKGAARSAMALGVVLALIFALAHVFKKVSSKHGGIAAKLGAGGEAPSGIVEIMGRYPISRNQSLVVMRFGRRILLLSNERGAKKGSGASMHTLCELTDHEEVAQLTSLVRDANGDSHSARFEQTLQDAGNATDNAIAALMQAQQRNAAPARVGPGTRRHAPGVLSNEEGDRLELTGALESPAASGVMKRRLGVLNRSRAT